MGSLEITQYVFPFDLNSHPYIRWGRWTFATCFPLISPRVYWCANVLKANLRRVFRHIPDPARLHSLCPSIFLLAAYPSREALRMAWISSCITFIEICLLCPNHKLEFHMTRTYIKSNQSNTHYFKTSFCLQLRDCDIYGPLIQLQSFHNYHLFRDIMISCEFNTLFFPMLLEMWPYLGLFWQ